MGCIEENEIEMKKCVFEMKINTKHTPMRDNRIS
jgi:hypothetical protein